MVSHLFYYHLALLALVWLFLMLHVTWRQRGVRPPPASAQPEPSPPTHTRAHEPKPFAGLTHKPHCALGERDAAHPQSPLLVPPDPRSSTNRRPRQIATSMHVCPHAGCDYRGWLGLGHLRAHGHPRGGLWRQFHGTSGKGYFLETHGTIFHGKQVAVERIGRVLACLAAGWGIRATARVFEVAPHTVWHWLAEAAEPLRAFSAYFLCDLHLEQLQLDELYAVLKRRERSPSWVWPVLDPTSKLLGVVDGGCRPLAMAPRVVQLVTRGLAPGCVPLLLTDGLKDYGTALLPQVGHGMHPERRQDKGPMPKPRWMPLPELLYAPVVHSYRRRRLVGGTHRVVFGTRLAIEQVLARWGWTINTALIARLNLDLRQGVAAIGRRVTTLCQGEAGLREQLTLFQV
jgi:hypothetical protein